MAAKAKKREEAKKEAERNRENNLHNNNANDQNSNSQESQVNVRRNRNVITLVLRIKCVGCSERSKSTKPHHSTKYINIIYILL
ncbi:hypothetical protein AAMO2058_001559400 [Amorphochlora amoebiformis]